MRVAGSDVLKRYFATASMKVSLMWGALFSRNYGMAAFPTASLEKWFADVLPDLCEVVRRSRHAKTGVIGNRYHS